MVVSVLVSFAVKADGGSETNSLAFAAPFRDGAVLQRGVPVKVWGTAPKGAKVRVAFGDAAVESVATDGSWTVDLPAMTACGTGRVLSAETTGGDGAALRREVRDVLVGEVWLASGQSNMEMPLWGGSNRFRDGEGATLIRYLRRPNIRFFCTSDYKWSVTPKRETAAEWTALVDPGKFRHFSAVATYFAMNLQDALDVPIGILSAHWGGTGVAPWTPREGYELHPGLEEAKYPVTKDWKPEMKKGAVSGACQQPTVIYNEMIAPLVPYTVKGAIWYQGEHNVSADSGRYAALLEAMHDGWKKVFANPSLKLYFAEIAVFGYSNGDAEKMRNMVELQKQQMKYAAEAKDAGIAILSDVTSLDDVHPRWKRRVGERLALLAMKRDYALPVAAESPVLEKATRLANGDVELAFRGDVEGGWYMYNADRGDELSFELQDVDGNWHPARIANMHQPTGIWDPKTNTVEGEKLVVGWRGERPLFAPKAVRYMHSAPWKGELYTNAGLPLGPFSVEVK